MSEEFILKACKSFQKCVDTIIEENGGLTEKIYCFVSIFFVFYFFKSRLILFYNKVGYYYYSRIFLILHPHPVYSNVLR